MPASLGVKCGESVELVGELVNHWGSIMSHACDKLAAVDEGGWGTQRKENTRRWKPLPSNAVKTVTENTSLCAIVNCKV
jgi:hypothetical protein